MECFVVKNKFMTFVGEQMTSRIITLGEMKSVRFRNTTIICIPQNMEKEKDIKVEGRLWKKKRRGLMEVGGRIGKSKGRR